jgi:hypothetical protein
MPATTSRQRPAIRSQIDETTFKMGLNASTRLEAALADVTATNVHGIAT